MAKKRKPTATPKQLHSQKPKKQKKQQQGTKKTTRVGLGLSSGVPKITTKGNKPKNQRQLPQEPQPVAQPVQHSTTAPTPVKQQPTTKTKQGASEIVSQWSAEWIKNGQASIVDKYLEQFGNDTQKLEEAIKSGQVERATTRLTDMQTGEVMSNVISNINTDENFYSTFIIESWRRQLDTYSSGEAYNMLKNWLDDMIAQNGKDNVAEMLQRGASEGNLLTW